MTAAPARSRGSVAPLAGDCDMNDLILSILLAVAALASLALLASVLIEEMMGAVRAIAGMA